MKKFMTILIIVLCLFTFVNVGHSATKHFNVIWQLHDSHYVTTYKYKTKMDELNERLKSAFNMSDGDVKTREFKSIIHDAEQYVNDGKFFELKSGTIVQIVEFIEPSSVIIHILSGPLKTDKDVYADWTLPMEFLVYSN